MPKVTSVSFGPYDNGHVLVGTEDGQLLALDPVNLQRIANYQISEVPVSQLCVDPLQFVIAGGEDGAISAVEIVRQETQYAYVELGFN